MSIYDPGMMSNSCHTERECPICCSKATVVFLELQQVPVVSNHQWPTREAALTVPRADIRLGSCGTCGHIWNTAFNDDFVDYTQGYENSLDFSPRFQEYIESLVAELIERHDLHGIDIIEIGCGQGHFLRLLCKLGGNRGLGFDPNYVDMPADEKTARQVTIIQDVYSEQRSGCKADFICCRHTLEHLADPAGFLAMLRRSIGHQRHMKVFFEVPNVLPMLRDLASWDIIYEHYSYFSGNSIRHLFVASGFDVNGIAETYDGQFLCIDATPGERPTSNGSDCEDEVNEVLYRAAGFAERYRNKVEAWQDKLEEIGRARHRPVIWGGGSKGVAFLNALKAQSQIEYIVDVNPRKVGSYIAGTGQKIVPPEFLVDYHPDVVIVMNPIYEDEIRRTMDRLGLRAEFSYA